MSVPVAASSKSSKSKKKEFSKTLFQIVNLFSLNEFKKYTNFTQVMRGALIAKMDLTKLDRLDHYVSLNFKQNIPDERKWKIGGFQSLKLTPEFYDSETAVRIFKKIFGTKKCTVKLSNVLTSELEEVVQLSSNDEDHIEKVDLTKDETSTNDNIQPPKRRVKYPRKQPRECVALPSGIATYEATKKFVDQIPANTCQSSLAEGFNEEIRVSPTEPTIASPNSSKRSSSSTVEFVSSPKTIAPNKRSSIVVISDVILVAPQNTEIDQIQPQPDPKDVASVNQPLALREETFKLPRFQIQQHNYPSKNATIRQWLTSTAKGSTVQPQSIESSQKQKPKIGPKSRVNKSTVNPPLLPPEELLEELMQTDPSKVPSHQKEPTEEKSQNVAQKPKPKIGPKSRMNPSKYSKFTPPLTSTQDLLRDMTHTNPSQLPLINEVVPSHELQPNVEPKTKIVTTQDVLQDLMHTNPSLAHPNPPSPRLSKNADVSEPKRKIRPKSRTGRHGSPQSPTVLAPEPSEPVIRSQNLSKSLPSISRNEIARSEKALTPSPRAFKSTIKTDFAGNSLTSVPCQECHAQTPLGIHPRPQCQIHELFHVTLPVESVSCPAGDSSESTELINKFKRSCNAQLLQIKERMLAYIADAEPSALSMKSFWNEYAKFQYENDNSTAETQLHNSNENVDDLPLQNQSQAILHPNQMEAELSEFVSVKVKVEKIFDRSNDSSSSDVQFIEMPANEPIEILMDSTQDLVDNMRLDNSEELLVRPIDIPQPPIASCSNVKSTVPSSSKGFLTGLPKITIKRRTYPPLEIVVESAHRIPSAILPNHDFSQQPQTPPSNENYEIEDCTMTDTQLQRYEMLNNENTLFLSSQFENYAFNAGKPIDPKAPSVQQPVALKRPATDNLECLPYKRRRSTETIKRELNWKITSIKAVIFKPLPNNVFHLEFQLFNNFDTFHVQDQLSIKRLLHLSDKEWKHIATILTASKGFRYDFFERPMAAQKSDLMSRLMNCFIRSIPLFVSSNIQFNDFMGHCLEVTEQRPLVNKCTDSAIDPNIRRKMREFKKSLAIVSHS